MGNRLSVTLISSFASPADIAPIPTKEHRQEPVRSSSFAMPPIWEQQEEPAEEISMPFEQPVNDCRCP